MKLGEAMYKAQAGEEGEGGGGDSGSAEQPQQDENVVDAEFSEVDDAVVFVSGHATNVSTLGYLFGAKDLIIHDEYIHNSSRNNFV